MDRTLTDGRLAGGVPLKPFPDKDGYLLVSLPGGDVPVHVLVLGTWRGPCPEGMERLHRNGNQQDNRKRNLRYGTKEENERDKRRKGQRGRKETGGRNGTASCPSEIVSPVSEHVSG
jgi:hypothetical protein